MPWTLARLGLRSLAATASRRWLVRSDLSQARRCSTSSLRAASLAKPAGPSPPRSTPRQLEAAPRTVHPATQPVHRECRLARAYKWIESTSFIGWGCAVKKQNVAIAVSLLALAGSAPALGAAASGQTDAV